MGGLGGKFTPWGVASRRDAQGTSARRVATRRGATTHATQYVNETHVFDLNSEIKKTSIGVRGWIGWEIYSLGS